MLIVRQTEPFSRWLRRLRDRQAVARINVRLDRIEEMDTSETHDLWVRGSRSCESTEGRAIGSTTSARARPWLWLCGGHKDSQGRDIDMAKKLTKALEG